MNDNSSLRQKELNAVNTAAQAYWSALAAFKRADNCYKRNDELVRKLAKELDEAEAESDRAAWEFHTHWIY